MSLSEQILYRIAKRLYCRNMGQSDDMTDALANDESYAEYRQGCVDKVLTAAEHHGIEWKDRTVLDLGCYDGAISHGYIDRGADRVSRCRH